MEILEGDLKTNVVDELTKGRRTVFTNKHLMTGCQADLLLSIPPIDHSQIIVIGNGSGEFEDILSKTDEKQ